MAYLYNLKKYLPQILEDIRKDIKKEEIIYEFADNKEQLEELIHDQEILIQNYLESFLIDEKFETKKVKDFYKNFSISYTIVYKSLNLLKTEIIRVLNKEEDDKEKLYKFSLYLKRFTDLVAKAYIEKEVESLKAITNSPFDKYLLFSSHKQWLEQLIDSVQNDIHIFPIMNPNECKFREYLYYPETLMVCLDKNLCSYLDDTHRIIHKMANSFYLFCMEKDFSEAYFIFKDLKEQIFKFTKLIGELYFVAFSKLENSFFKLVELLQHETNLYITMLNLKGLKSLNEIYGETFITEAINQLHDKLQNYIKDDKRLVVLQDRVLLIKGVTGDFYMLNIDYSINEYHNFLLKLKKLISEPIIVNNTEITFSVSFSGIKINKYAEYKEYEYIKMLHLIDKESKKYKKDILIYVTDEQLSKLDQNLKNIYNEKFLIEKLTNEYIDIVAQPIFNKDNKIHSLEIFGRIVDNDKLVQANKFISEIYKMHKIQLFDSLVLDKIIVKQKKLKKLSNKLCLNVAFKSLFDIEYMDKLSKFQKETGIDIILELTENKMINRFELIEEIYEKYKIPFSIDDFGIGCFSLKTINELVEKKVLKALKIDGTLIKNMHFDKNNKKIVKLLSKIGDDFDLKIGAEFIESEDVFKELSSMKIDLYQGYYLSKPKKLEYLLVEQAGVI